jgi:hypothetical protein
VQSETPEKLEMSLQDTLKPITALFKGREDDEPMTPQDSNDSDDDQMNEDVRMEPKPRTALF